MADFENLQLSFGKLDTKIDPRAAPPGTLTVAENCQTQIEGVYKKRNGYTALATPGFEIGIMRLAVLGSSLLACSGSRLYAYDHVTNGWHQSSTTTGDLTPAITSQKSIILDQSTNIRLSTTAVANGVRVDAWIDALAGAVNVQLITDGDGSFISRTVVDSTGRWDFIHSVVTSTYIYVVFSSTAMQKVNLVIVDCVAETVSASTAVVSGANVSAAWAVFDVAPVGTADFVLAWCSNTPDIRVVRFNGPTAAIVAGPSVVSGETVDAGFAVVATDGEAGYLLYHSAVSGGIRSALFNPATTVQTVAPFMVEADPVAVPGNLNCALVRQPDGTHARAFWDWGFVAVTTNPYAKWTEINNTGTVSSLRTLHNARLSSKPYLYGTEIFINVLRQGLDGVSTTNVTIQTLLANTPTMTPVALHGYRESYAGATIGQLADVSNPATGIYRFDGIIEHKFLSSSTLRSGIVSHSTDFVSDKRLLPLEVNRDVLFANGAPAEYDGVNVIENNFIFAPEIIAATPGAVGAGGMDNGTRSYIAVFESSDAAGNTARSTTSVPRSATTTAGAGLGKVTLLATQLNMTRLGWTTKRQQGIVSFFRTANGGTIYYFIGSVKIDPTAATATYVDQVQDSAITGNRQLYTNGGVVDREPPPPSLHMVLHQGRVWGISSADRKMVFYSGDVTPGEDVWFSSLQRFRVEPGGDLTALASLDDRLILFEEDRIFKVTGRGANQLAQNNDLSLPQLISSDCGCIDPRSIVQTPDGIMFQSAKGIYLLNRSEQVSYIGAAVDYFTSNYSTCTSAHMVPDRQEIRFTMTNPVAPLVYPAGVTLVYNYASDSWTHWSILAGTPAADATLAGSVWHWVKSSGTAYAETPTTFLDAGTYAPMTLETAWIQPSGAQGLVRVNRVMLLGQSRADHGLEIQLAKDYSDAYMMDGTWGRTTLAALSLEQVAHHLEDQKGQSFRVRVNDYTDGGTPGEGFWTTGLLLKAKPIRGAFDKLLQAGAKT